MGRSGYEAVEKFLLDVNVTIKKINTYNKDDQIWHHSFFNSLRGCKSLEDLRFRTCKEQDLILLTSALSELPLRELDLSECWINVAGARAISHVMSQKNTIQTLSLRMLQCSEDVFATMIPSFLGRTSVLRILDLKDNDYITDKCDDSIGKRIGT